MGQSGDCAWLQIVLDDGTDGWVAGDETLARFTVPCTALPVSSVAIVQPSPTTTPPSTVVQRQAQPTATRQIVTSTPAAPLPAPTRNLASSGPSSIIILSPADGYSSLAPVNFSWTADTPLAPGQEFEVVFWNAATETEAQGRGWVRSSTDTTVRIDPSRQPVGAYRWGVFVVAAAPYQRLRYLGPGYTLTVPGEGGSGGSSGGGGDSSPGASQGGEKP
jgi:hypothetical protein